MSEDTKAPAALLPAIAQELSAWFPEFEGRFIAVSEIQPFDNATNIPTLPIGFVALVTEKNTGSSRITIDDDILVHFAFKPVKYKNADASDSPFFAYYDYEPIRDKLLAMTQQWRTPRNTGLLYKSLDIEASEFAVYMTFRFSAPLVWCVPEYLAAQPKQVDIMARMCQPKSVVPCIKPSPPPVDPCAG